LIGKIVEANKQFCRLTVIQIMELFLRDFFTTELSVSKISAKKTEAKRKKKRVVKP